MRAETKPRILLVDEVANLMGDILEKELSCKVDINLTARDASLRRNPLDYNVAIIDASDDCLVDETHSLSEFLKMKNPDIIIIGTSVDGLYFRNDGIAKQLYDKRISNDGDDSFYKRLKTAIEEYGFEFPEPEGVKA